MKKTEKKKEKQNRKEKHKYLWQILKYKWEFLRRNEDYKSDWKKYEKDRKDEQLEDLLKKWGPLSYPPSFDFSKKYGDIPKKTKNGWASKNWSIEIEEKIMAALDNIFLWMKENKVFVEYSHEIWEGDDDSENAIGIPHYNELRSDYLPWLEESIPDEVVLKITNFKLYIKADKIQKAAIRKRVLNDLKEQLSLWEKVAEDLKIQPSAVRHSDDELYDRYLKVWDLAKEKKTNIEIAKSLWPDEYQKEKNKGNINFQKTYAELLKGVKEYFDHIKKTVAKLSIVLEDTGLLSLYNKYLENKGIKEFNEDDADLCWNAYTEYLILINGETRSKAEDLAVKLTMKIEDDEIKSGGYNNMVEQARRYRSAAENLIRNPNIYFDI